MSHLYTEILKQIEDPTIPERAAKLLHSPNLAAQEEAVEILIDKPSPAALDRLWELRCSLEGDAERFSFRVQVDEALSACVKLAPDWLQRAILRADPPSEPFATLAYLLVQIAELEAGERVWRSVRDAVLKKTPETEKRALSYVFESFGDEEALARLPGWVHEDRDLAAPAALRALEFLNPEDALAALGRATLEPSLLMARSWWLPQLLAFHYDRTSEILRRKIEAHEKPWFAAAVYDHRENLITPEILNFLLDVTGKLLEETLAQPGTEGKDPHRPFHFLADVSRLDLLACFETRRGTRFEEALTEYLIRQGPNDTGWHRWTVERGIAVLQKIGGNGFTQLANHHLRTARTRLGIRDGLLLGIRRPDGETVRLVVEVAEDPERGGQMGNDFPLVQYEAVKALAALGRWRETVQGGLRLGLRIPKSLPEYLERHVFSDDELEDALRELRSGAPSPGALLMVGFSGRPELAPEVRATYGQAEKKSEIALACLLALESLRDLQSERLFLDNLDSPKNGWVAVRALLGAVRTPQSDEALLERLRHFREAEGGDRLMLTMNLLIREQTRERAARLLWRHLDHHELLYYTGDTIEYLAVLDMPDVREFLRNIAFSDQQGPWHGANRHAAIKGLARFDPESAFEAAKVLVRSEDQGRLLCPETLLELKPESALDLFGETLATTKDFLLIAAIGEALDRHLLTEAPKAWLANSDHRMRQGACLAMESLQWSQELEELVLPSLHDRNWDVRVAGRAAFESLRLSKETVRLAKAVTAEKELGRRWTLVDAALAIGYPGVVAGYGAHSWFGPMCEGQPYVLRKHALSKLEEKRKKLREELAKRERA